MGWFSRALKAANAAMNSWYAMSDSSLSDSGDTHLIGNVYINRGERRIFTKAFKDESAHDAVISITATNKEGNIDHTIDTAITSRGAIGRSFEELEGLLSENATGTITWSLIDQSSNSENVYYCSIKDWDGKSTKLFQINQGYGMEISIDRDEDKFYFKALDYSFKNVHLYMIGYDGSDYDFRRFDVEATKEVIIDYPSSLDELLPINRVSIWFELEKTAVKTLFASSEE